MCLLKHWGHDAEETPQQHLWGAEKCGTLLRDLTKTFSTKIFKEKSLSPVSGFLIFSSEFWRHQESWSILEHAPAQWAEVPQIEFNATFFPCGECPATDALWGGSCGLQREGEDFTASKSGLNGNSGGECNKAMSRISVEKLLRWVWKVVSKLM